MTLSEAFQIVEQYFPQEYFLQSDHICAKREAHTRPCPLHPDSAIYTDVDAILDTPERLRDRLAKGGTLKPS